MLDYLDTCRFFIYLKYSSKKVTILEDSIYDGNGDSHDIPEPFVVDDLMRMGSTSPFSNMLVVF